MGWSIADLAKAADVGVNTVSRFENHSNTTISVIECIQYALEKQGVVFNNGDFVTVSVPVRKV